MRISERPCMKCQAQRRSLVGMAGGSCYCQWVMPGPFPCRQPLHFPRPARGRRILRERSVSPGRVDGWWAGPLVGTYVLVGFLHREFQIRAQTGNCPGCSHQHQKLSHRIGKILNCAYGEDMKTVRCPFILALFQGLILWFCLLFHAVYSAWGASFWLLDACLLLAPSPGLLILNFEEVPGWAAQWGAGRPRGCSYLRDAPSWGTAWVPPVPAQHPEKEEESISLFFLFPLLPLRREPSLWANYETRQCEISLKILVSCIIVLFQVQKG